MRNRAGKEGIGMLKTGLVSVSFRNKTPEEIIKEVKKCGLQGIEWGGDIHVVPGDIKRAAEVRKLTEEEGLGVFAYGSYFRPGEHSASEFGPVLESAVALKAPVIRVWAGAKWSFRADEAYVSRVAEETRKICDIAAGEGIQIAYEYHGWTLTDNRFSAMDLYGAVAKENMKLYWQPDFKVTGEDNLLALKMLQKNLKDIHVFYWDCLGNRFPLKEGEELWKHYISILKEDGKDHNLMLEFVRNDSFEQLEMDAEVLKALVKE